MAALPTTAYKVLTAAQMTALEMGGSFAGAPVDLADGYIHMSTATQLTETVDKHFTGQSDLHVAAIDLGSFGDSLEWEESARRPAIPAPLRPLAAGNGDRLWPAGAGRRRHGETAGRGVIGADIPAGMQNSRQICPTPRRPVIARGMIAFATLADGKLTVMHLHTRAMVRLL